MAKILNGFACIVAACFMLNGVVNAQDNSSSDYIQLVKAKKKRKPQQEGKKQQEMSPQSELPEPYKTVKILPFDPQGWYWNAHQIELLFKNNSIKTAIEVGCWLGLSTRHIATLLPAGGKLYAIDHWKGSEEHQSSPILPQLYDQFLSNVIHAGLTHKIVPMRMSSLEGALQIEKMGVLPDLIYIDASHDTESVLADLNAWYPFVEGHGIICGDDWSYEGVSHAVKTFAYEHGLTIDATGNFWCLVE